MSKPKEYRYLALGDSYTIGEAIASSKSFPMQLVETLQYKGISIAQPTIVARTGWTTQELSSAMDHQVLESSYDLVTLLIGVNNQYRGLSLQDYRYEFKQLLLRAIKLADGKPEHVVVLSIPDYGYTPFGETKQVAISAEIDLFNVVNQEVANNLSVAYLSVTGISRRAREDGDLVALDGLHPSAEMYRLWVEELSPKVEAIIISD